MDGPVYVGLGFEIIYLGDEGCVFALMVDGEILSLAFISPEEIERRCS